MFIYIYKLFAIKIKSRDIVNHMIYNIILIANYPYYQTIKVTNY